MKDKGHLVFFDNAYQVLFRPARATICILHSFIVSLRRVLPVVMQKRTLSQSASL